MNKILLIGRVGQDPDVHKFDNGNKVAKFSLATTERYKNRAGEKVEETTWFNIVIFGKLADVVEKYVHKGDLLALEGKVKNRSYDDKDGNKKYITEVVVDSMEMLGSKSDKPKSEPRPEKPATAMDDDPDPFGEVPPPGKDDMPV